MGKIWYRCAICCLQKKGLSSEEIHTDKMATLRDDAPAFSTVKKWVAKFKRSRQSIEDNLSSGRSSTATTQENIDLIHKIVLDDSRLTVNHITYATV